MFELRTEDAWKSGHTPWLLRWPVSWLRLAHNIEKERSVEESSPWRETRFADMHYACPWVICLFIRWFYISGLCSARTFSFTLFHPRSMVGDLRTCEMAQSAKLWLIHHVKYPVIFHSLSVDYLDDVLLIFRIRQETHPLINSNYLSFTL